MHPKKKGNGSHAPSVLAGDWGEQRNVTKLSINKRKRGLSREPIALPYMVNMTGVYGQDDKVFVKLTPSL